MSDCSVEILIAIAAIASAVGGAFAAIGAMRSADSAREALKATADLQHKSALREIAVAAGNILVEVERVRARAKDLRAEYQTATIFSGSADHSGYNQLTEQAETLSDSAVAFVEDAQLFADGARSLRSVDSDELDRVLLRQSANLAKVRAIREELERRHDTVATSNNAERERRLSKK